MCKVYNQIGSLTAIKVHLYQNNVKEFKSVNELINFQKNYSVLRQQIISNHKLLIEHEKITLSDELVQLGNTINVEKTAVEKRLLLEIENLKHQLDNLSFKHSNVVLTIFNYFKKTRLNLKIKEKNYSFDFEIAHSLRNINEDYNLKKTRNQYIDSSFDDAVMDSCLPQLQELDRKKRIIDLVNNSIYGALGEQKVVKELEKLPEDFILINDFSCNFYPAIYNRQENFYIKSIQIDHILISPSGIFLIETKNWSQHSLNNSSLYSPVQQIKRANFVLYRILNGEISGAKLPIANHHWGNRKIPIRNLIVLINKKPIEEFQHVKILTLNDLLSYINYFKPCFSTNETQLIANYLLNFLVN